MFKKVIKNTSILGAGTLASRFLGCIRDILVANFFGTSAILEAFIVSFRLPNLFRSIFGEGFSDSVATPVLSEHREDKKRLFEISSRLLCLFMVAISICSILGIIFSKYLVIIIAPGFKADPYRYSLAVSFTKITFLYLFLIALSSTITSVLYSLKKFFIPAINPIFLNISFIVGLLFFSRVFKNYILVICVLVGGVLQVIFPFVSLKREGFILRFNLRDSLKDQEIIRMLKLFPPRLWASIVYQLSVLIDTILASFTSIVGAGGVAALWFAQRYVQLPLALFVLSLSRVAIVDLSYYHKQGDLDNFKKLFVFSFQNIIFFIIPISIIYLFLSEAIIDVILRRGDFKLYSLGITASAFFFYSFGLFFFCGIKLMVSSFYALKDTLTPAKITAISLLINVILSAVLMFFLKIGGVALGSSLAALFNFTLLYRSLSKRIGKIDWQDTRSQFIKVFLLSVLTAVSCRLLWDYSGFHRYVRALIIVVCGSSLFITGGYIIKLKQILYFKKWVLKKR